MGAVHRQAHADDVILAAQLRHDLVLRLRDTQLRARLVAMKSNFCAFLALAALAGIAAPVIACGPMPPEYYAKTEKRVRERFDSAESVVLVTLLDVRRVKKIEMEIELEGEKATFRVDRVFKGGSKPGDKLILTQYSSCTNWVVEKWDGPNGPIKVARQWLIYRNESDTEMPPHDMSQPGNFASYDLKVLPNIVRTRTNKQPKSKENQ